MGPWQLPLVPLSPGMPPGALVLGACLVHALRAPLRCERARSCCAPQPFQAPGRPLQSCPAFPLPEALLEVAPEPFLEKGG